MRNVRTVLLASVVMMCVSLPISLVSAQVFRYPEDMRPASLLPFFADDMSSVRMVELIFDGLIFQNKRGDLEGALATQWSIDEDKRGVTFRLRRDVKWHDGKAFGAGDVVFTVKAAKDKRTIFQEKGRYDFIKEVRATGPLEVKFTFTRPLNEPIRRFAFKILPRHGFRGTAIARNDRFSRKPIGTGPYKVTRYTMRKVELESNTDYWKSPRIGQVVMQHTPDKAAQVNLLQYSGGRAGVQAVIFLPPKNIPLFENSDSVVLEPYHTVSWWYLAYNHANPALKDPVVRNAIALAMDREELLEANLGKGDILSGPFTESSPFYDFDVQLRSLNVEEANAALDKAGYAMKGGVRQKGKTKLEFKFVLNRGVAGQQSLFLGIQAQLKKIGVIVKKKYEDNAAYRETVFKKKNYDLTMNVWSFAEVEGVRGLFHSKGTSNFINYSNPEVDSLFDSAAKLTDYKQYQQQMMKLHGILNKDLPYFFLWSLDVYSGVSKRVRNVFIAPFYYFTSFREWELSP